MSGTLGNANSEISLGGLNRLDDSQFAYSLGVGFAATENFSIEADYQEASSLDAETDCPPGFACLIIPVSTQADLTRISLSLVASVPLSDRFDVYGRVGWASWDIDFDGISAAFDTSGDDLLYGAGLRASLSDFWTAFVEYQRIELDVFTTNIGLSYRF